MVPLDYPQTSPVAIKGVDGSFWKKKNQIKFVLTCKDDNWRHRVYPDYSQTKFGSVLVFVCLFNFILSSLWAKDSYMWKVMTVQHTWRRHVPVTTRKYMIRNDFPPEIICSLYYLPLLFCPFPFSFNGKYSLWFLYCFVNIPVIGNVLKRKADLRCNHLCMF